MNKNFRASIQKIYQWNPLMRLVQSGWSSDQIKRLIIDTLDPYFENKQFLREKAIECLSIEAANVGFIAQDTKAEGWFRQLLDIHRLASKVDEKICFHTMGHWEQAIAHGRDEFWSAAILERDLAELPIEDFKFEAFRVIGMVVEACLQPHLKALLAQVRLTRGNLKPNENLDDREFGTVVDELFAKLSDKEIVAPAPWNIRLNQWRNMAQHHQTQVRGDKVIGIYGVGAKRTQVAFTRPEVLQFITRLDFVLRVVRGARAVFLFDNLQKIEPNFPKTHEREDTRIFHLAAPLATQGFQIERFEVIEGTAHVRICDKVGGEIRRRTVHCSQFVYPIWQFFPYDLIDIEFVDISAKPRMHITASGEDVARCNEMSEPWEELANVVKFHPPKSCNS